MSRPDWIASALAAAPWGQLPQDAGQMLDVRWSPAGEAGCIRRTVDLTDGTCTYSLHRWRAGARRPFEPWNGRVFVWSRGRRVSEKEAARLLLT